MMNLAAGTDLIVFSSEKFNCDEIRTSKLMKEFADKKRVYFFEKPIIGVGDEATYIFKKEEHEVVIIQPYLPDEISVFDQKAMQLNILKDVIHDENISHYTMWTDTPIAMHFIRKLSPDIIVYDCLKDYSNTYSELESELFQYADVVLTSEMKNEVFSPLVSDIKNIEKTRDLLEKHS